MHLPLQLTLKAFGGSIEGVDTHPILRLPQSLAPQKTPSIQNMGYIHLLLADHSYEISYLIFFENQENFAKIIACCSRDCMVLLKQAFKYPSTKKEG